MMRNFAIISTATMLAAMALGCAKSGDSTTNPSGAAESATYLLTSQPTGAQGVAEARQSTKEGDEVVVTGRVGGDAEPFVDGVAAFTIVDPALEPCPANEGCPTPWDYCCDVDKTAANKAMVKVVDQQGRIVATSARQLLNVEPLSQVFVHGHAKRDDAGNLTVLADGVYVAR